MALHQGTYMRTPPVGMVQALCTNALCPSSHRLEIVYGPRHPAASRDVTALHEGNLQKYSGKVLVDCSQERRPPKGSLRFIYDWRTGTVTCEGKAKRSVSKIGLIHFGEFRYCTHVIVAFAALFPCSELLRASLSLRTSWK